MRVLLDTTFARRAPLSGTAVYLEQISSELAKTVEVELIAVANNRRLPPAGGGLGSARNALSDAWWTNATLKRVALDRSADVIHHPLPAISRGAKAAQVITVHDLSFERLPHDFDRGFRTFAHHFHRAAARAADAVICVSETTAGDVQELWGVPRERIVVALHGRGQELRAHGEAEGGYFLYVGDDEPRKRVSALLEAYAHYRRIAVDQPLPLVLAGGVARSAPGVRIEPRPGRERLAELYTGAVALVHPSSYEGFGLTVLEAMSLGTPVLAAPAPAVAEVCGEAARYVDPTDARDLAEAMAGLAETPSLRRELARRGQRRASEFSWSASASAHLDAYSLALESRRG